MTRLVANSSLFLSSARTRAELDADYTARRFVASLPDVIADWASRTAQAKALQADRLSADLRYGERPRETIDYFRATVPGGPLLVFIHGGFWQSVSKEESGFIATGWTVRGVNVAVLEYTLAPEVSLTTITAQTRAGLQFLLARAQALGFDARRVVVSGHSAGAQLAAMSQVGEAVPVRGLVLLSGVFELAPIRGCYVNDRVQITESEVVALSPARHVPAWPLPLVVAVGENEPIGFHEQSRMLAWQWREAGCPTVSLLVPRHTHFSILDDAADPESPLGREMARMLGAK